VDEKLAGALAAAWRSRWPGVSKIILRSSTNCEDLEGFNGAGLYTSVSVSDEKQIGMALAEVWWVVAV